MSENTTPTPTEAKGTDYSDFVALMEKLSNATAEISTLQAKLNEEHLSLVRDHLPKYRELQTAIGEVESAIEVLAKRNPQWFAERASLTTPVGVLKRTTSKKLEVADELISISLIKGAKREADFVVVTESLNKEALEKLGDDELKKYGIKRVETHNFNAGAASVDLGDAVKAEEKSAAKARKDAERAAKKARREAA